MAEKENNLVDEKSLQEAREKINQEKLREDIENHLKQTINFDDVKKTLDEFFDHAQKNQENREMIAKFMGEMKEDIIPEVEYVVESMIPTYAYKKEVDAVKVIWKCFEAIAALDDPRVNAIIASEVEKYEKKKGSKGRKKIV